MSDKEQAYRNIKSLITERERLNIEIEDLLQSRDCYFGGLIRDSRLAIPLTPHEFQEIKTILFNSKSKRLVEIDFQIQEQLATVK